MKTTASCQGNLVLGEGHTLESNEDDIQELVAEHRQELTTGSASRATARGMKALSSEEEV